MRKELDENKPIFLQIKDHVEDSIMDDSYKSGDRVPSTNEFAAFYQINPATAGKGINELVAEGILVKRRGVGMFVTESAKDIVIEKRKQTFYDHYMLPLKHEAKKLRMREDEILEMWKREDNFNED
ncbi:MULTISPECIES: GntR family transcriptional regulator [Oceanobacillus]|uniref:GntR family transcriptional regulator n=1 Tax=Oceanobacillus kimchii TaxID=746691 RepID=A0ABQ5TES3_9BACI|nr:MULTISPECIES: GntR family transcriptional regulator [Oceanobacillus]MBT2601371.1 GntR family transcriptional regulator [Oceanobacillus sp. ISL-74]MBT2653463.1 GntR family transcriptional regulator [Oceanobacillus sp. ISL-73]MCT1578861.1 GntR family transcriptional regulator [Oceanobacillus kimchii]MCT2137689.1 GntR family transcriptional regulator [Oceanobacillus kimchii]OEH53244.1 GntR family transcriptional regulator [Oceanobacillus sp. E9]